MQTVDELVDQLRTQLDETDIVDVSDAHLLQALNRAQRAATNVVTRKYDALFWAETTTTTDGTADLDIPADAFARKIEMVEIAIGQVRHKLRLINNHETSALAATNYTGIPHSYTLSKNAISLYPTPSTGLTVYISYSQKPEPLVVSQGRITSTAAPYVIVDALGSGLSTSVTDYAAYVNLIDYTTGAIRATMQINSIDTATKKVTFKTTGLTRSTVLGRTVATALPTGLTADDYICAVDGTCVPELDEAFVDYMLQHAIVAIKRRFGENVADELSALSEQAKELELIWAGRPSARKIVRGNAHYHGGLNRRTLV